MATPTHIAKYAVFIVAFLCGSRIPLWSHSVGEPELEKLPIWNRCCRDGDCFPQAVNVLNKAENGKTLSVQIDGVDVAVEREKFSPVPSPHTWVCYVNPKAGIRDDNIRCILYPQRSGTT